MPTIRFRRSLRSSLPIFLAEKVLIWKNVWIREMETEILNGMETE